MRIVLAFVLCPLFCVSCATPSKIKSPENTDFLATPIPASSTQAYDFRGSPTFTNPEYEKLFLCQTYEELHDQLLKAYDSIAPGEGEEGDCAAQFCTMESVQLARIRCLYILGRIKEADALLERTHSVHD